MSVGDSSESLLLICLEEGVFGFFNVSFQTLYSKKNSLYFFCLQRLNIAREFGDKAAERRAHSNLGNAHIFLGEFETAAEHYK